MILLTYTHRYISIIICQQLLYVDFNAIDVNINGLQEKRRSHEYALDAKAPIGILRRRNQVQLNGVRHKVEYER